MRKRKLVWYLAGVLMAMLVIAVVGCQGPAGPTGPTGPSGPEGPAAVTEEPPEEVSPVAVDAGADQTAEPGTTVTLEAAVTINDDSTVASYAWTQVSGLTVSAMSGATSETLQVTLANAKAYKDELMAHLVTLDRFMVQAINPHSLEAAEETTFEVTVTTSSGSYSGTVNVMAELPYVWSLGIGNVPVREAVLLHGKDQSSYSWSISGPSGSGAALDSASGQNPLFTPDVVGQYTLTESNSGATIEVYAGTWAGAVSGQDANGRPLSADCTGCHNGTVASDQFSDWKESGHAEIFTDNLNTSTHYGEGCFDCHTVGFNKSVSNGGFDDAADYAAFLNSGMINSPSPDNWTNTLANYPEAAQLANIQCESCHGPNNGSTLHMNGTVDDARISISSGVCGACHGEPPRHGRFQQWEESGHAKYELAIERATNSSCARCHTGQGFIEWLPQLEAGDSGSLKAEITWTTDTVEAITCAACHDPHDVGTVTGEPNDANLRVMGNTAMLPAGFQAMGVGNGALCMTCHNTRNGARNDVAMPVSDDRAPHVAAQADVLMGQNAYFVTVGARSSHSYIENTCTTCHMVLSPPPAEFSYNLGGTNHSFEASLEICSQCHGAFDGGTLMEATEANMEGLVEAIEHALLAEITAQTDAGNTVVLTGFGPDDTDVSITDSSTVTAVELTEYHGRIAMNVTVSGTTYEGVRLSSDTAVGDGTLLSSDNAQIIAKAAWNYFLLHGDGSEGIHNPSFTLEVINASLAALAGLE